MGWTERIICFGLGYLLKDYIDGGRGPLVEMDTNGLKVAGLPVAVVKDDKVKIGGLIHIKKN